MELKPSAWRLARGAAIGLVGLALGAVPAYAQSGSSAPLVTLDHYEAKPDEMLTVTVSGFQARLVTIVICGNEARRGSADCAMPSAVSRDLTPGGVPTVATMVIKTPPAPCPCVVRVSNSRNDEVAVSPITLLGVPTAPVVGTTTVRQPLEVAILAEPVPSNFFGSIKSGLGGATSYDVTITVKNRSTEAVEGISLDAVVGRGPGDVISTLLVAPPTRLGPNESWREVVRTRLPAPVYGDVQWRLTVSGAGPSVTAVDDTSHQPVLLVVLAMVLLVDLSALAWRVFTRWSRRRAPAHAGYDVVEAVDDEDPRVRRELAPAT